MQCDEAKPRCSKCTKTNSECVYSASTGTSPKTLFIDERAIEDYESLSPDMYSMSVDLLETDLDGLLSLTSHLDISSEPTSNVRILQHFQAFTSLTLGGSKCQAVFHSFVGRMAWQHSYLMHMVLAVSSAHLKRLHVDVSQMKLHQMYSIAEAAHWQTGLQLYQKELRTSRPDFDATIATTFLTIIFTFSLDDEIPQDSYVTDDDEKFRHAINPLAATGGFRALRDIFGEFMNASIWKTVLKGSDDDSGTYSYGEEPGIDGLPIAFVALCDLNTHSTRDNNEYHYIVRLLTPLLRLEYDDENFTKLMAFCGRTWPYFRPLLLQKDPRALLLISYWFAMLRQLNQWWIIQRAKTECMAIVTYLSQLQDAKIAALLPYPASFGLADLSYIWDPPDIEPDSSAIFERYFQKAITRTPPHLLDVSP